MLNYEIDFLLIDGTRRLSRDMGDITTTASYRYMVVVRGEL